jgi:hypothetical protein
MHNTEPQAFKVILMPDFENAMIGIARHNGNMVAVYDFGKCIDIMVEDGMKPECAVRYLTDKIDKEMKDERGPAFVVSYSNTVKQFSSMISMHGNN